MVLLEVDQLSYSYGDRKAVDRISFAIRAGELFGLLGANGAGKTTSISCIAGLLSRYQGTMKLEGTPFRPSSDRLARSRLGVVPQELAVYENLTGQENLKLFADLCGLSRSDRAKRVEQMLEFAGLEGRQHDRVSSYSGGMKRRLNLVAGMIHSPSLLLLDEPTVGVDPQSRNHLFDSIESLKRQGISMLYTTHYMEEAERLCDRIAIMNEGTIIAMGTMDELSRTIGQPGAKLEQVFLHLTGRTLRDE